MDVQMWIKEAKEDMKNPMVKKANLKAPTHWICGADLAKSFDHISRPMLIQKMIKLKFPTNLIKAVTQNLTNTKMTIGQHEVRSNIGLP